MDNPVVIVLIVLGVLAFLILVWFISTMNTLRRKEVKVHEAESGIDVALTKRFDTLSKMVDTVKGYTKHEAKTFENVVKWRKGMPSELTMEQKQEFMRKLNDVQADINVAVERYPDLKAEKVFTNLQRTIADVEEHLQASRRLYNSNVSFLNRKIVTFPISIVAARIGMDKKAFFEAELEKRADVKMEF